MSLTNYKRRAEGVRFEGEVFGRMDLRSMKAIGSSWTDCSFVGCKMDLTHWPGSKFERTLFQSCSMPLVNFAASTFEECLFKDCNLEQASFMGSAFNDGGFKNCRMAYGETMFQDVTVKPLLRFEGCNLHGSNLDFRQVEKGSIRFEGCDLWGAKTSFGCTFWNSTFDDRTVKHFLALVARAAQDPRIAELAGDQYAVVCRAMDGGAKRWDRDSTTSRETPASLTPDSPAPTAMTQTPKMKLVAETRTRS